MTYISSARMRPLLPFSQNLNSNTNHRFLYMSNGNSRRNGDYMLAPNPSIRRLLASGILIGLGLGGLLDTIIFHEILQWHHMVSNVVPPATVDAIQLNIFADGVFAALTIVMMTAGTALFLSIIAVGRHQLLVTRYFAGLVVLGLGIFNVYDGIVNHLVLGLHHAVEMPDPLFGDLMWIATLGFAFIGAGAYLIKHKQSTTENSSSTNTTASAG